VPRRKRGRCTSGTKLWTKETNEFVMKERRFNEAMDDHGFAHTKRDNKKLYTGFRLRDPMGNPEASESERWRSRHDNSVGVVEDDFCCFWRRWLARGGLFLFRRRAFLERV
jgi:hypothetical protein